MIQSPLQDSLPTQRQCQPYHGWISNDDEVDLVQLTPAPLPERIEKLLNELDNKKVGGQKPRNDRKNFND